MIKQIIFKSKKTLGAPEEYTINFNEKINVIIGPKGGGKSTLFDLVAGIKKGYISKNVIDALAAFNLEFSHAIKFNNELVNVNQLTKKTKKETEEDFKARNDVIFQDDPIKKDIHKLDEIDKQKKDYIQTLTEKSPIIIKLIERIEEFYNGMYKISEMNKQNKINWSNSFQLKNENMGEAKLFSRLNYNPMDINQKITIDLRNLDTMLKNAKEQIIELTNYQNLKLNNVFQDEDFEAKKDSSIETIIKNYQAFILLMQNKRNSIDKIKKMVQAFEKSYKTVMDDIKKKDFVGEGLRAFEKQSQDYFQTMAKEITNQKIIFEELINEELVLKFNEPVLNSALLSYKINDEVIVSQDEIVDILKIVLPTPGGSVSDIAKWLLNLVKNGPKTFDRKKISNCIGRNLKKDVKVLAEGVDYDTMSLGQKSIYGIKIKFNKSIDETLFLDQPEDNLDNYTIATNILEMIERKSQQVFIVTHNANIGILTNPGKVIVADLNNDSHKQYWEESLTQEESKSIHYLEGGKNFLEKRYQKLINNKGEK